MADFSTAPAVSFEAVTTSDTVNLTPQARALYVGVTGDVVAVNTAGQAITFVGVLAGSILPIQAVRVNSTGTTASSIVALY